MTRAVLLAAAALAGCVTGRQADPASFDAADWLTRARLVAFGAVDETDADDPRAAPAAALTRDLDAAVAWGRACDRYLYSAPHHIGYNAAGGSTRGLFTLYDVGSDETVVAVTCDVSPHQGTYALVHIVGLRAVLLAGQPAEADGIPPVPVYATPAFDAGGRSFTTFARSRGLGDCGLRSAYEITGFGTATLVEAQERECDYHPEDVLPADAWPVVYPR